MVEMKHTNFRDSDHRLKEMAESQLQGGVTVDPTPITAGQEVTILYNGLLAKSGAQQIYLHVGYGSNDNWQMVTDYPMYFTGNGWEKTITVAEGTRLNFCFKDSANNWDNNNGNNWSFIVHNGRMV